MTGDFRRKRPSYRMIGRSYGQEKLAMVLEEFKRGTLHSGSRTGPLVRSRSQALAIALNQSRRRR